MNSTMKPAILESTIPENIESFFFDFRCLIRVRRSLLTTKCGEVGGTYAPPPANFFPLSFLIDFFILSEIGFLFKENYWEPKICCSDWDISKKHFFCPTTTYSGLCSSDYPCMKNLFPVLHVGSGEMAGVRPSHFEPKTPHFFARAFGARGRFGFSAF